MLGFVPQPNLQLKAILYNDFKPLSPASRQQKAFLSAIQRGTLDPRLFEKVGDCERRGKKYFSQVVELISNALFSIN
ncbi:hypothetical protein [Nostoc sp.]|uniref:hypothetical protein n=1 Tax=Nostoc sp. TaxID=1180 RepID=UPI002FF7610C